MLAGPRGGYKVRQRDSVFPGGKRGLLGWRFTALSRERWSTRETTHQGVQASPASQSFRVE